MRPFTQLEGATLCLIDGSFAGWWHSLYSKHKCWPSQLASHRSPWWPPVFQFTTIKHAPPRAGATRWVPSVGITVGALVQRKIFPPRFVEEEVDVARRNVELMNSGQNTKAIEPDDGGQQ